MKDLSLLKASRQKALKVWTISKLVLPVGSSCDLIRAVSHIAGPSGSSIHSP
jgi:hypothetical protein